MVTFHRMAVALFAAAWCVSGAATTGNELADRCDRDAAYCIGYTSGVIDAERYPYSTPYRYSGGIRFAPTTQEELELIELNRRVAKEQLKIIEQLAPFQVRLIGQSLAEHGLAPEEPRSKRSLKACLPYYATLPQLADVVTKYLRDNPAKRHGPAAWLVVEALQDAFPCK